MCGVVCCMSFDQYDIDEIEWETDVSEWEFDGEYMLQKGVMPNGDVVYRQWVEGAIVDEVGYVLEESR